MAGLMYVIRALEDGTHRIVKTERGEQSRGLQPMYDAIGCSLVEMVGRGNLGGVPVALLVDEEGLFAPNARLNLTACDVFAVATKSAPLYLQGGGLVGDAVLVHDDELRGFTDAEIAKIERVLNDGGFPMYEGRAL
jgi:hypothetical protein